MKNPKALIFLTVFIDLVGFGIIIPLSPYIATHFNASPFEVGMLMACYSGAQFLFSHFWGQLSDRIGRRPVLLISLFAAGISHLAFGFADQLWILFLTRTLAGVFGANISTAMAVMSDLTDSKDRSKGMGMVGAAIGLGFILGPTIGGVLAALGEGKNLELVLPAVGAATICLLNFLFAFKYLPETLKTKNTERKSKIKSFVELTFKKTIGPLMVSGFLSQLAMAIMEGMLFLFMKDLFDWDLKTSSFAFAYIGVILAFTQGYLIRKLSGKILDKNLLLFGMTLTIFGLWGVAYSNSVFLVGLMMTLFSLGRGLGYPTYLGSLSRLVGEEKQGEVMGVNQSLASLGRILGPLLGGFFYEHYGMAFPFHVAGFLTLVSVLLIIMVYKLLPLGLGHQSEVKKK